MVLRDSARDASRPRVRVVSLNILRLCSICGGVWHIFRRKRDRNGKPYKRFSQITLTIETTEYETHDADDVSYSTQYRHTDPQSHSLQFEFKSKR